MIEVLILHEFTIKTSYGVVDKIWDYGAYDHAFESRSNFFFYFPTQKYFSIQFRSLERFKVLIRVMISDFYMAWRKNFT